MRGLPHEEVGGKLSCELCSSPFREELRNPENVESTLISSCNRVLDNNEPTDGCVKVKAGMYLSQWFCNVWIPVLLHLTTVVWGAKTMGHASRNGIGG